MQSSGRGVDSQGATIAEARRPVTHEERLSVAVVSVTRTARGRFFWAAWWSGAPCWSPWRRPDATGGGAESAAAARVDAERVTGRALTVVEGAWAYAANRALRGEPPRRPAERRAAEPVTASASSEASPWAALGLRPGASLDAIRQAHRARALETHPDHGGDADAFRAVQQAYERLMRRRR